MSELISEILEKDATGDIADIYADIRRLWGVPNVTTIVRHVASVPGALEWYWAAIGPVNACGDFQETALALVDTLETRPMTPLPEVALRAMGVDAEAEAQIQDVYAAYDINNRPNILFVCVLQRLLSRQPAAADRYEPRGSNWSPPPPARDLVAMVQADDMPSETLALAQTIGSWGFPAGTGFLPGVYRHLANWPAYLAHAGAAIWPYLESGEIRQASENIIAAAEAAADEMIERLPAPPPPLDPPQIERLSGVLQSLNQKIPEMIVICKLLGGALPEEKKES